MTPGLRPGRFSLVVRKGGLEPPRPFGLTVLSRARLPFRHFRARRSRMLPLNPRLNRGRFHTPEEPLKVEYNEETPVRKSLSFEIDADVVDKEIADRAKDYAKKLKLPGFRAGKVPTHVVKQRFKANLLEDVAEKLVNKLVFEEIEGRGLKPLASPKVVDLKIDENQPLTFRAVFETLPIVELPDWRGLRAKARQPNVQDADVDREIE